METSEIVKKLKRSHLLLRIWFWAAMRSPYFSQCELRLQSPLIEVKFSKKTCRYGFLRFEVTINRPMLTLDIDWEACLDFAAAKKQVGEIIDLEPIDEIPF